MFWFYVKLDLDKIDSKSNKEELYISKMKEIPQFGKFNWILIKFF